MFALAISTERPKRMECRFSFCPRSARHQAAYVTRVKKPGLAFASEAKDSGNWFGGVQVDAEG
jgi:hypothetical protein